MDHEKSESSTQSQQGNWVTTVCIIALLLLCAIAATLMVVGAQYPPPDQAPTPSITIDTGGGSSGADTGDGANGSATPAGVADEQPGTTDEDPAGADPPNPSDE